MLCVGGGGRIVQDRPPNIVRPWMLVYVISSLFSPFVILNSYKAIREAFVSSGNLFSGRPYTATFNLGTLQEGKHNARNYSVSH
jgi:hypothetical protein